MKRTSIHTERRRSLDVTMTPMIDVVFLLLVFFVWTASFQAVEYALESRVSEAAAGSSNAADPPPETIDFDEVVLRVLWTPAGPSWRLNDVPLVDLNAVRERLQLIHQVNPEAPIIIHPDGGTPLEDVIDVYDLSRLVGFEQVNLAAETS